MSDPSTREPCPLCGETVTSLVHRCPTGQLIRDRRKADRFPDAVTTEEVRRVYIEQLMKSNLLHRIAELENKFGLLAQLCKECRENGS